jgi:hypothetical protein
MYGSAAFRALVTSAQITGVLIYSQKSLSDNFTHFLFTKKKEKEVSRSPELQEWKTCCTDRKSKPSQ